MIKIKDLLQGREEAKVSLVKREPFLFIAAPGEKVPSLASLPKLTPHDIWYLGTETYVEAPSHVRYLFAGGLMEEVRGRVFRRMCECAKVGPHILILVDMISHENSWGTVNQAFAEVCRGTPSFCENGVFATTSEYLSKGEMGPPW